MIPLETSICEHCVGTKCLRVVGNHTEHMNIFCGQEAKFLVLKLMINILNNRHQRIRQKSLKCEEISRKIKKEQ